MVCIILYNTVMLQAACSTCEEAVGEAIRTCSSAGSSVVWTTIRITEVMDSKSLPFSENCASIRNRLASYGCPPERPTGDVLVARGTDGPQLLPFDILPPLSTFYKKTHRNIHIYTHQHGHIDLLYLFLSQNTYRVCSRFWANVLGFSTQHGTWVPKCCKSKLGVWHDDIHRYMGDLFSIKSYFFSSTSWRQLAQGTLLQ